VTPQKQIRSFPPTVRLLLVNQFGVNFGFYLVLPYLAAHLTGDIAMSVAMVGLVLGVRTLSQQGMTLFGGSAADRLGYRPMIVLGCGLRVIGFGLFAVASNLTGVLFASIMIGLAGALFSPACRAYLAHAAGDRKLDAFAAFHTASNAGALIGPIAGGVLLIWGDFRLVSAAAAAAFLIMTVAQISVLPPQAMEEDADRRSVIQGWKVLYSDRRFLVFVLAVSGLFLAYNQLYLLLPLEVVRVTGVASVSSLIFVVATVVGLFATIPLTRWFSPRLAKAPSVVVGAVLCAIAFVPTAVSASVQSAAGGSLGPDGPTITAQVLVNALPVLSATAVLALGYSLAVPFIQDLTASLAPAGLTATYLGMFSTASGLVAAVGNVLVGTLQDLAGRAGMLWLPWICLTALQLAGACLLLVLHRRRAVPDRTPRHRTRIG